MDVLHTLVAVVAQGPIVVVGEEPNQLVGAVLGRGEQPQGRAPALALPRYRCLASRPPRRSSWPGWNAPVGDARRCSGPPQRRRGGYRWPARPLQQPLLGSLGLLAVWEEHGQVSDGCQVPRTQSPPGGLLERPVMRLSHRTTRRNRRGGSRPRQAGCARRAIHLGHARHRWPSDP